METPNRTYIILDNIVSNAESIEAMGLHVKVLYGLFIVLAIYVRRKK